MKELKDRDNLDLFGLICQLAGRYALYNNETLHDAFFEAKNEFEKRLKALESQAHKAVMEDLKITWIDKLKEASVIWADWNKSDIKTIKDLQQELQTLKEAIRKTIPDIEGILYTLAENEIPDELNKSAIDKLKELIGH